MLLHGTDEKQFRERSATKAGPFAEVILQLLRENTLQIEAESLKDRADSLAATRVKL